MLILPIKLTSLDPQHIKFGKLSGYGLDFKCPHCDGARIAVLFMNTMDGRPSVPNEARHYGNNEGYRWARSGLTWDDLSLHPGVNVVGHGEWWVLNGQIYG